MSLDLFLTIGGVTLTAVGLIIGGFWAVATVAGKQFERRLNERFEVFAKELRELRTLGDERLKKLEAKQEQLDQDIRRILIELPREYVARSDYVRRETLIEAKIDQLRLYLENWVLKGGKPQ